MGETYFNLRMGKNKISMSIPEKELVFNIAPKKIENSNKLKDCLINSLNNPIGKKPLSNLVDKESEIVILVDDMSRPTPQDKIIPILLDILNEAGVKDENITLLIALGTHRYMEEEEIIEEFGEKVIDRVEIFNHRWKNDSNLIKIKTLNEEIPIEINKIADEADYLIGVGCILPHVLSGWSGGCKIIQPGICSDQTTQKTHLAAQEKECLDLVGDVDNHVREMIEDIGLEVGLDFIVNVVLDGANNVVEVVSGHPIKAHRKGVKTATDIYIREIPQLADIVVVEAYPDDTDYWQGLKALTNAYHGVRENGIVILVGEFGEGISPVHEEMAEYGNEPYEVIEAKWEEGKIEDGVCAADLLLHAKANEHLKTICVSSGMTREEKKHLNFIHAESIEEALYIARKRIPGKQKVGIIKHGDVVPKLGRNGNR